MLIDKGATASEHINEIAFIKANAQVGLLRHHFLGGTQELLVIGGRIAVGINHLLDGLTQRLAGDRGAMGAVSTHLIFFFDHGDAFARLGRFHGRAFATRATANHNHVIMLFIHGCHLLHHPSTYRKSSRAFVFSHGIC